MINKDTLIYGSFSDKPGNNGCVFFNNAFQKFNINAIYKSFYSTDISKTIESVKHLNFSGFALSMPLKLSVYEYLDEYDESVIETKSCNTVVIKKNKLFGYNTDWIGIYNFFSGKEYNNVNIIGTGGFSKSIEYAFKKLNIAYKIFGRNDINTIDEIKNQIFINATPAEIISSKNTIIDARPHTDSGKEIFLNQAKEQFKIYTGINYV